MRQVDGEWLLWKPKIREVEEPDEDWFLDQDILNRMKELAQKPENKELSLDRKSVV